MVSGAFVDRPGAVLEPFWEPLGLERVGLGGFLARFAPRGSRMGECGENVRFFLGNGAIFASGGPLRGAS